MRFAKHSIRQGEATHLLKGIEHHDGYFPERPWLLLLRWQKGGNNEQLYPL